MFIITSRYLKPIDVVDKYLQEHRDFLDVYYKQGIFMASGRKASGDGGVILARGGTRMEMLEILKKDPFTREGISTYEITEFSPNRVAEGLEKLRS